MQCVIDIRYYVSNKKANNILRILFTNFLIPKVRTQHFPQPIKSQRKCRSNIHILEPIKFFRFISYFVTSTDPLRQKGKLKICKKSIYKKEKNLKATQFSFYDKRK